jgi:hypothetical protein
MVASYSANGEPFVPGRPRLWYAKQIFFAGAANLALAPDGKRFAVFTMPEATGLDKGSVHVTFLLNFFDELRRRAPAAKLVASGASRKCADLRSLIVDNGPVA